MQTISITYTLKWRFINYPHIQITTCRKVINVKTGRIKKQCLNGGSLGYWINGKFTVKSKLNENLEKIKEECPF